MAKEENQHAYSFFKFSVRLLLVPEVDTRMSTNKQTKNQNTNLVTKVNTEFWKGKGTSFITKEINYEHASSTEFT